MKNIVKKIWNTVTGIILALLLLLTMAFVGARMIGIRLFTVLSGSMEPTYETGSLLSVKPVDYTELKAGDVITFLMDKDTIVTHRIVEVLSDEKDSSIIRFRTKGDANKTVDGRLVHYRNVIGKPVLSIPKLGYVIHYIQKPQGTYAAVSLGAFLIVLLFLPDLFCKEEHKQKTPEKSELSFRKPS